MKQVATGIAAAALALSAAAQTLTFDKDAVGEPPAGWSCGATGGGRPHWTVALDPASTDRSKVLLQDGRADFPWCVRQGSDVENGFVEVKFRPISGQEDQAGGVVWRWKDGDNYYVARANARENNVSLYYTENGRRKTLKYVGAPVEPGRWHALRVDFSGTGIAVSLDGKRYIEFRDSHISGAGSVGVWTKADSVTAFRDFRFAPAQR